jgi:hypothetical protein
MKTGVKPLLKAIFLGSLKLQHVTKSAGSDQKDPSIHLTRLCTNVGIIFINHCQTICFKKFNICIQMAKMKIILSRKGFDSASGGFPSPIFPDGRMLSLPIPDKQSKIKYKNISWFEHNLGDIVSSLTNAKIRSDYNAHLDPDLNSSSLKRKGVGNRCLVRLVLHGAMYVTAVLPKEIFPCFLAYSGKLNKKATHLYGM